MSTKVLCINASHAGLLLLERLHYPEMILVVEWMYRKLGHASAVLVAGIRHILGSRMSHLLFDTWVFFDTF